ncbi:mitochondrial ribonuclease P catalytic subunit [Galendromus occidentalis]|uniref:Mitochondrial ribonuclease P catalytic subunit n=1 Tax=Galendromus occidentalis TaxID=34638 RepID=A0AAJ7L746_9ACAR|nr:mitochondrial ribonuclease P catalytic subunit [Galendromus occidentalis]
MWAAWLVRRTPIITRNQISQQLSSRLRSGFAVSTRAKIGAEVEAQDIQEIGQLTKPKITFGFETSLREAIVKQSNVDWNHIQNVEFPKAKQTCDLVFRGSFATAVFLALQAPHDSDHLRQFVAHVGRENLSLTLLAKYMACCLDSEEILRCWREIGSRSPEVLPQHASYIIRGLLRTPEWRSAVDILKAEPIGTKNALGAGVIAKLFEEGADSEAFDLYSRSDSYCIDAEADACMEDPDRAERYLDMIVKMEFKLSYNFDIEKRTSWRKHFEANRAKMKWNSECSCCRTRLPPGRISSHDFSKMREACLNLILNDRAGSLHLSTTPGEMDRFQNFIRRNGPYDAIIDGLNVVYRYELPLRRIHGLLEDYKARGFSRILILLRSHAKREFNMMKLPPDVDMYCVQNASRDDPYIILAALLSHDRCRLLSFDFYRDHIYRLKKSKQFDRDDNTARTFFKWLNTHKDSFIDFQKPGSAAPTIKLRMAPAHFPVPHVDIGGWHIPFVQKTGYPPTWLCLRRRDSFDRKLVL